MIGLLVGSIFSWLPILNDNFSSVGDVHDTGNDDLIIGSKPCKTSMRSPVMSPSASGERPFHPALIYPASGLPRIALRGTKMADGLRLA